MHLIASFSITSEFNIAYRTQGYTFLKAPLPRTSLYCKTTIQLNKKKKTKPINKSPKQIKPYLYFEQLKSH